MAKKAFIIGKNTRSLRWSEKDAELMSEALSSSGYEITLIKPSSNKSDIIREFDDFVDEIAQTDTVIFYFSGHAYSPKNLNFVVGEDLNSSRSRLDASVFTSALTNSDADTKLIILDCCRANAEGKDWKPEFGNEKYRMLTASESLSQSKEVDDLGASLMTFFLHKALTENAQDIADDDNKVRIEKIYKWIKADIQEYDTDRRFPLPSLLGDSKIDFSLATVKKTTKQIKAQKEFIEKLWEKHDNLIYDYRYWEGKLVSAKAAKDDESVTESHIKTENILNRIKRIKTEISGWASESQKESIRKIELYENIELKLRDYTELPEPDSHFVGREEIIKKVFERILSRKKIAVTGIKGMGGIGKTAITIEICNLIKESWQETSIYPEYLREIIGNEKHFEHGILWIRFERKEPLKLLVRDKIAYQLGLQFTDDSSHRDILSKISKILRLKKYRNKVLIILDSAEQNESNFEVIFRAFNDLPILVTTREKLDIDSININQLDIEDAIELFQNHYLDPDCDSLSNKQIEYVDAICVEVGYLPLAIKILAKRAKKYSSKTIMDILNEFREKKLEVLNAKILSEKERKNEDAIICFKMSFDDNTVDVLTKNVFMRCGLFYLPFEKHKIASAYKDKDISSELDELERISLIEYDNERKKYYLHPLMREFAVKSAEDSGDIEELYKWHKDNFLNINLMDMPFGKELNDTLEEIFKTIEYFVKQDDEKSYNTIIDFTDKYHNNLHYKGFWERKLTLINYGIEVCNKVGNHDKLGAYLLEKGDILGRQGKYRDAQKFMKQSLKFKENYFVHYSLVFYDYSTNKIKSAFYDNFSYLRKADIASYEELFSFLRTNAMVYNDYGLPVAETLAIVNFREEKGGDGAKMYQKSNFINALNDLINIKSFRGYYSIAIDYGLKILELSNREQFSERSSSAIQQLVENYLKQNEIDKATMYLAEYEKLIAEMGLINGFRTIHLYKGQIEYLKGNYDDALTRFQHIEDKAQKDYWFGKAYLRMSGQIEDAEKHLLEALKYYKNQKNAIGIAKIYTQLAFLEYKKESGKLIKAVEYLCLATNTKKHYEIIDFKEESEIRKEISQKDKSTYDFLEKKFVDKYIDVLPNFLIHGLEDKIVIRRQYPRSDNEMLLIPEGTCFVSKDGVDNIIIYDTDFILKNISAFWEGLYAKRQQATEYYLYPFYIDKHLVTKREYKEFCIATKREQPKEWLNEKKDEFWNQPVVEISYRDAHDYAKWCKKELPTQAEWEKALTEKNSPFLSKTSDVEDNNAQILQGIVKEISIHFSDKDEVLRNLVGGEIYTYLSQNPETLKNWGNVDKQRIYELGDFNEYSASVFNNLLLDVSSAILPKVNWKRLFTLIAYSFGSQNIKAKILNQVTSLNLNQIKNLYKNYINEAILIYRIADYQEDIIADYLIEKNKWTYAVRSYLGIKDNSINLTPQISEFISGEKTVKKSSNRIVVSKVAGDSINLDTGFRCVKPIFSNGDYMKFINSLN